MVTRRNKRTFVEDELLSDQRELQQSAATPMVLKMLDENVPSGVGAGSSSSSSSSSSDSSNCNSNEDHRRELAVRTDIEPSAGCASGNSSSSSRASTSSTASSLTSTPSTLAASAAVPDLLEVVYSDLGEAGEADDTSAMLPGAPVNFGSVLPGLFRSSYPKPEHYPFLRQLGLKTIVTLVDKNFTEGYREFMTDNGIRHHMFAMKGTKKEDIPVATMESILNLVLDHRNFPLLIHCNQGRHRTGCVVAVVRKIAGWDSTSMTEEYRAYAGRKVRDCDIDYISAFRLSSLDKLLASDGLDIEAIVRSSRRDGPTVGPLPPTPPVRPAGRIRLPNFFRTTVFSMTVLFIWMISGSKILAPNRR